MTGRYANKFPQKCQSKFAQTTEIRFECWSRKVRFSGFRVPVLGLPATPFRSCGLAIGLFECPILYSDDYRGGLLQPVGFSKPASGPEQVQTASRDRSPGETSASSD
jgi:hypothetical protein